MLLMQVEREEKGGREEKGPQDPPLPSVGVLAEDTLMALRGSLGTVYDSALRRAFQEEKRLPGTHYAKSGVAKHPRVTKPASSIKFMRATLKLVQTMIVSGAIRVPDALKGHLVGLLYVEEKGPGGMEDMLYAKATKQDMKEGDAIIRISLKQFAESNMVFMPDPTDTTSYRVLEVPCTAAMYVMDENLLTTTHRFPDTPGHMVTLQIGLFAPPRDPQPKQDPVIDMTSEDAAVATGDTVKVKGEGVDRVNGMSRRESEIQLAEMISRLGTNNQLSGDTILPFVKYSRTTSKPVADLPALRKSLMEGRLKETERAQKVIGNQALREEAAYWGPEVLSSSTVKDRHNMALDIKEGTPFAFRNTGVAIVSAADKSMGVRKGDLVVHPLALGMGLQEFHTGMLGMWEKHGKNVEEWADDPLYKAGMAKMLMSAGGHTRPFPTMPTSKTDLEGPAVKDTAPKASPEIMEGFDMLLGHLCDLTGVPREDAEAIARDMCHPAIHMYVRSVMDHLDNPRLGGPCGSLTVLNVTHRVVLAFTSMKNDDLPVRVVSLLPGDCYTFTGAWRTDYTHAVYREMEGDDTAAWPPTTLAPDNLALARAAFCIRLGPMTEDSMERLYVNMMEHQECSWDDDVPPCFQKKYAEQLVRAGAQAKAKSKITRSLTVQKTATPAAKKPPPAPAASAKATPRELSGRIWAQAPVIKHKEQFSLVDTLVWQDGSRPSLRKGNQLIVHVPTDVPKKAPTTPYPTKPMRICVLGCGELTVTTMKYRVVVAMTQDPPNAKWEGPFNIMASKMPRDTHRITEANLLMDPNLLKRHLLRTDHLTPGSRLQNRLDRAAPIGPHHDADSLAGTSDEDEQDESEEEDSEEQEEIKPRKKRRLGDAAPWCGDEGDEESHSEGVQELPDYQPKKQHVEVPTKTRKRTRLATTSQASGPSGTSVTSPTQAPHRPRMLATPSALHARLMATKFRIQEQDLAVTKQQLAEAREEAARRLAAAEKTNQMVTDERKEKDKAAQLSADKNMEAMHQSLRGAQDMNKGQQAPPASQYHQQPNPYMYPPQPGPVLEYQRPPTYMDYPRQPRPGMYYPPQQPQRSLLPPGYGNEHPHYHPYDRGQAQGHNTYKHAALAQTLYSVAHDQHTTHHTCIRLPTDARMGPAQYADHSYHHGEERPYRQQLINNEMGPARDHHRDERALDAAPYRPNHMRMPAQGRSRRPDYMDAEGNYGYYMQPPARAREPMDRGPPPRAREPMDRAQDQAVPLSRYPIRYYDEQPDEGQNVQDLA
jgi:hypothetical protein